MNTTQLLPTGVISSPFVSGANTSTVFGLSNATLAVALAVIAISAVTVKSALPGDRNLNLPGPRGWPVVGSWFDLGNNWAEYFRQAAKEYGDVR